MRRKNQKKKNVILVVDSNPQTYRILDIVLDREDFKIVECSSGKQAIRLYVSIKPDIIILDMDTDDMDGKNIIPAIREWSQVPIILTSPKKSNQDVIEGLNMGADDYVIKPFDADVLCARINASLRKSAIHETGESEISNGPLRMNLVSHQVFLDDKLVALTPKEYNLLRYFVTHCGKMLGHREILQEVWGKGHGSDSQYLRVFIGQLREKIERGSENRITIRTEVGVGYRMEFYSRTNLM